MPTPNVDKCFFACSFILVLTLAAAQTIYQEPYRPQVHSSPREHWTNDPNGLVYFHGEYHLFFQFNPLGDEWGHMSWGHAVSTDLLHWHELPVAIPEKDGEMIFTGSVVVDSKKHQRVLRSQRGVLGCDLYGTSTIAANTPDSEPCLQRR
jgi:sucrose-6-phosphate hydrolase SacC (GH32 family)